MGLYKYVNAAWRKPKENLGSLWKERLIVWRGEPVTLRIDRPTRIDAAHSLGYKAKPGFIIVRQRVLRGGRQKPKFKGGRRPKRMGRKKIVGMTYQEIAERRAAKKYVNLEVLNSYWVGEDGIYKWYEVILIDKSHPVVLSDHNINWIANKQHTKRVFRGLTSSGRKARGLRHKGKGSEKTRPSKTANWKRRNK
ncbi:MAG: 50S ribosomal protein L15e [Candidatus Melainabacteria bacterium]|nr:50S ribosomal protein L15e [Candidatus Melainabacteria bacterium]